MQPMKMRPAFKDYLWGGTRLREEYGKDCDLSPVAESWEISCHPDGPSTVMGGPCAGKTLAELLQEHPEWMGTRDGAAVYGEFPRGEFPLLIKLIDAAQSLSIQVHPADDYARRVENQQGKNEMWYVVDAAPGAELIIGFQRPVDKEELRRRIADGTLEEVAAKIPVRAGDCFSIPAGMLHAIGGGILIAEVQQNSNVTYRVYDFGRKNPDGSQRELHVDKALDVIDSTLTAANAADRPPVEMGGYSEKTLTDWSYFTAKLLDIREQAALSSGPEGARCLLCVEGSLALSAPGCALTLRKGESAFVPAGTSVYTLAGTGKVLLTEI